MKTTRLALTSIVLVALVAAACSASGDTVTTSTTELPTSPTQPVTSPVQGELARAEVDRSRTTDATAAELAALVTGDAEFAFDLFRIAATGGENTLLSPYSIAAALTMTYAGARGDTATEISDVLHFGVADDRIHAVRNELDLRITAGESPPLPEDDREPFAIEIANSLWGQAGYPFLDDFLVVLAENYDAGMNLVDFVVAAEDARVAINTWVEEKTNGRILDLIPPGVVTDMTRLILVNAIWFKASWADQFNPENTTDGGFTRFDGSERVVPLMHGGGLLQYAVGDGYQSIRLPYAGDAAMVIVLPDSGRFDDIAGRFDPRLLAEISRSATSREVTLTLPRFEFTAEFALKPVLQDLGMAALFIAPGPDSGADFTGMVDRRELFVQEVVHKAFIAVDEEGTEAAAATAVIVGLTSAGSPPVAMTVDRPFLFVIEHAGTGEILFLGQVADPS